MTTLIITIFIFQFLICLAAIFYSAYLLGTSKMQTVFIKSQAKTIQRAEREKKRLQNEIKLCNNRLITRLGGATLVNPPRPQAESDKKPVHKIVSPSEAITRLIRSEADNAIVESVTQPEIKASMLPLKEKFLDDASKVVNGN